MTAARRPAAAARRSLVAVVVLLVTSACGGGAGTADTGAPSSEPPPTTPCPSPGKTGAGAGAQLPDVTLPCLGQPTELAVRRLPATPVVLTFWASWCAICRKEMPGMQRVADAAGDQVLFLGVDVKDGQEPARWLLDDLGVTWPNLYDESGRLLDLVPSPGVPTTLLLAPDGEIVDRTIGAMSESRLRSLLSDRLGVRFTDASTSPTG